MVTQALLDYIRQEESRGVRRADIRVALVQIGWNAIDIDEALSQAEKMPTGVTFVSSIPEEKPHLAGPVALLKCAIARYSEKFPSFISVMFIFSLAWVLPFVFMTFSKQIIGEEWQIDKLIVKFGLPSVYLGGVVAVVFIGFMLLIQAWAILTVLYIIAAKNEESFGTHCAKALKKLPVFWWLSCLIVFTFTGGLFLFIIPGILFSILFCLSYPLLVDQDVGGFSAFLTSKRYIKGFFFAVAGRLLFLLVIVLVFLLPFGLITGFAGSLNLPFVDQMVMGFFLLFCIPLFHSYLYAMYLDLKRMKADEPIVTSITPKVFLSFLNIFGFFLLITLVPILFYISLNSALFSAKATDTLRNVDVKNLQKSLATYYKKKQSYPTSLPELQPLFIPVVPKDPDTHQVYEYKRVNDGKNYSLCITYSNNGVRCVSKETPLK